MPLKLMGVTANCGNQTLGQETCEALADCFQNPLKPPLMVINCQEVHREAALGELQQAVQAKGLAVASSDLMVTRTKKTPAVLAGKTGMCTFVIYDPKDVVVSFKADETAKIRRSPSALPWGSSYNKGGLRTLCEVTPAATSKTKQLSSALTIQCVSGHLDSNHLGKRVQDWQNIRRALLPNCDSWEELEAIIPNASVCGYDANTRNIVHDQAPISPWAKAETPHEDIAALHFTALGGHLVSADSTYKTKEAKNLTSPDKKRPGYVKGGSLDFVAIQNNTKNYSTAALEAERHFFRDASINLSQEQSTARDHNVVGSSLVEIDEKIDPFVKVKTFIASQLRNVAPELTDAVLAMEASEEAKAELLSLYQTCLAPEGCLDNYLSSVITTGVQEATEALRSQMESVITDSKLMAKGGGESTMKMLEHLSESSETLSRASSFSSQLSESFEQEQQQAGRARRVAQMLARTHGDTQPALEDVGDDDPEHTTTPRLK